MVQPYNYQMAGIQSPFESVVQGLKLGATLESLQLEREKQRQATLLAQQQAEQQRQNQEFMTGFFGRVSAGETPNSADWLRIGTMLQPEQVKMAENIRQQMTGDQQSNFGATLAKVTVGLWRNPEIGKQELRNFVRANPNSPGAERMLEIAEIDPRGAAVMTYGLGMGLGGRVAEAVKELPDLLGMKATDGFQVITADQAKSLGLPPGNTYQRNASTGKIETITTAGNRFEVIPGAEAEKIGLPAGAYQREIGTGKISAIGPGGTNITLKTHGPISPDHIAEYDKDGNLISVRPAPGSVAAQKAEAERKAEESRVQGQSLTASVLKQEIGSLRSMLQAEQKATGMSALSPDVRITGVPGRVFQDLPGSARRAAQGYINTITANIAFDKLNQIRRENPNGGALGNVTDTDMKLLQATLGEINLDSRPEVLLANLERLDTIYADIMRKISQYPNAEKYGFAAGAQSTGATATAVPGGAAGPAITRRVEIAPRDAPGTPIRTLTPAGPAPAARTPSPAGAAPPVRGGADIGNGFRWLE